MKREESTNILSYHVLDLRAMFQRAVAKDVWGVEAGFPHGLPRFFGPTYSKELLAIWHEKLISFFPLSFAFKAHSVARWTSLSAPLLRFVCPIIQEFHPLPPLLHVPQAAPHFPAISMAC